MKMPGPWVRRALTIPLMFFASVTLIALTPVILIFSALYDLAGRRRWACSRLVLALCWFAFFHLWGFSVALVQGVLTCSGRVGGDRLERWSAWLQNVWVLSLFAGVRKVTGFQLVEENRDVVPSTGPMLLFLRHASAVDTLLPVVLISGPLRLSPRYVVKTELKWDPVFDVIGQRMRNIFVVRGSSDPAREIANVRTLAEDLDARSVVVIYPEGTRRTPERRARILDKMRARSDARLAYSEALQHTLPPKHGGPLALMDAAERADIVICGHVGFDDAFDIADVMNGSLIGKKVFVRYWHFPSSEVPRDEVGRAAWLDARWRDLDAWVASVSGATHQAERHLQDV